MHTAVSIPPYCGVAPAVGAVVLGGAVVTAVVGEDVVEGAVVAAVVGEVVVGGAVVLQEVKTMAAISRQPKTAQISFLLMLPSFLCDYASQLRRFRHSRCVMQSIVV